MREFKKPNYDWLMSMQELSEITKEIYGIEYDIQMGERGQGEYDVVTTGEIDGAQGYDTGLGQGYSYNEKYLDGYKSVFFAHNGATHPEFGFEVFDDDFDWDENFRLAMEHWINQDKEAWGKYGQPRPFDKVKENGEYELWQPDIAVVLTDLAKRKEIPEGTYMIQIDW